MEVFVHPISVTTYSGAYELWGRRECWLKSGDCYQPVNVVEALEDFTFVVHVPPPDRETLDCGYAASGMLSIRSRRNWAGERWPCRAINQRSL